MEWNRRSFLTGMTGAGAVGGVSLLRQENPPARCPIALPQGTADYKGPNVVIVRFGGGCRRREVVDPRHTYAPHLLHRLAPRGVLFGNMMIDSLKPRHGVDTSHGQGTIYILSGSYNQLDSAGGDGFDLRFVPSVPTVFEYLRAAYDIAEHETLVVNSEDRKQEEFLTYSNHLKYGLDYRCQILSLYRFKRFLYPHLLKEGRRDGKRLSFKEEAKIRKELSQLKSIDTRQPLAANERLTAFWEAWRAHYGDSGLKNPRGDRLLTELALWSMRLLQPRLMIVNYTDADYVHWGIRSHYFNAISVMDQGLKQIANVADSLPFYRDNTVFVVVPDCGRDSNPFADVPFQHHFNTKSAHEIFCLVYHNRVRPDEGVNTSPLVAPRPKTVLKPTDQAEVAGMIGALMGFPTMESEDSRLIDYLQKPAGT